jgi:uncharacterized protein
MAIELLFEWDETKSSRNFQERGFGFDYASLIFQGQLLEEPDRRRDYGESRIIATGAVDEFILVVVYTWRGSRRRIISARVAKEKERDAYRQAFPE